MEYRKSKTNAQTVKRANAYRRKRNEQQIEKRTPLSFSVDNHIASASNNLDTEDKWNIENQKQTRKRANSSEKTGRAGRQFIAAHVPLEAAKQFKILALQEEMTTQDLLTQAINDLFSKHGLSRIA